MRGRNAPLCVCGYRDVYNESGCQASSRRGLQTDDPHRRRRRSVASAIAVLTVDRPASCRFGDGIRSLQASLQFKIDRLAQVSAARHRAFGADVSEWRSFQLPLVWAGMGRLKRLNAVRTSRRTARLRRFRLVCGVNGLIRGGVVSASAGRSKSWAATTARAAPAGSDWRSSPTGHGPHEPTTLPVVWGAASRPPRAPRCPTTRMGPGTAWCGVVFRCGGLAFWRGLVPSWPVRLPTVWSAGRIVGLGCRSVPASGSSASRYYFCYPRGRRRHRR